MSHLDGASVEPYLLEKSRVLAQGEGERNFHILYELVAGAIQDGGLAKELKVKYYNIQCFFAVRCAAFVHTIWRAAVTLPSPVVLMDDYS